jgi:TP53 regulating kinase-like protein
MSSSLPDYVLPLPAPFSSTSDLPIELITQGAEAILLKTTLLSPITASTNNSESQKPVALKIRPRKTYRHPVLDARLTKTRILAEARVLVRCKKEGVNVPGVVAADWEAGWLALEWIEGRTVRQCLDDYLRGQEAAGLEAGSSNPEIVGLMEKVGRVVGRLHEMSVVHGDLTTSNLMLRHEVSNGEGELSLEGDVFLIDFGLATQSGMEEDRAVDLYVLERAFGSTHPQAEGLFKEVLRAYGETCKNGKQVLRRLEDVRMRGRKKSMIG